MTVPIAFAIIGGIILIGFFANLLFRVTKIPNVLLLIAIGIILGPISGWIASDSLINIAPFFGTMALLIILFEGGLELDIESVIRQAPKAAFLAFFVFLFSVGSVFLFAFYILQMTLFHSILIAAIFSASSPAICLPVLSGLSIKNETKTILKLESTLGDVLLIVTVLLALDFQVTGAQSAMGMLSRFFTSFAVAFVIASIAGAMWSRLIGWMGREPLAYMLTLGFVFLLYFSVEELGGSAAMAVLIFGILLENMHIIAGRASDRVRVLFGIDIRAEQFVLHEFMKNITEEFSFLIRTFFFVYLGLILNFRSITPKIAVSSVGIVILLLASRWIGVQTIRKRCRFSAGEMQIVRSMLPRGLATAVMAFIPTQYGISGTELLPIYAFTVIVLTNVLMTGGVIIAEKHLARERIAESNRPESIQPRSINEGSEMNLSTKESAAANFYAEDRFIPARTISPEKIAEPFSFKNSMSRLLGIRWEEREWRCIEAIKAASLGQPQFWVMLFFASTLTILGLVLNQSAIIIGAALIVPIALPVVAAGLALAVGDVYLFLKLLLKLLMAAVMTTVLAWVFSGLLPFSAFTAEIASRTSATILDFLVAFFAGMAGAAMLFSRRRLLQFLPGAIVAITILPPLAVMGLGIGNSFNLAIFRGGAVLFAANLFAAILGSSLVYAIVGMPALADLEVIRDWKQRELSHPIVNLIFERLRLKSLAGRTGSVRSRLVVAAVFLLALVVPLQMAFNQLSLEFRARQAVSEVEKMFESPGRSVIINSTSRIGEDAIAVQIQVATNSFFAASDIQRFEERIFDRTGKPTRLDLVQSLSDIGEGDTIRGMLRPSSPTPSEFGESIPDMTIGLRSAIEKNLRIVPIPKSMAILGISAKLSMDRESSSFRVDYLSDVPLSEDARMLLVSLLEHQMKLKTGSLTMVHIPARYALIPDRRGEISIKELGQLQNIQNVMEAYSQLRADVILPDLGGKENADKVLDAICAAAPLLGDPSRKAIAFKADQENETVVIALKLFESLAIE